MIAKELFIGCWKDPSMSAKEELAHFSCLFSASQARITTLTNAEVRADIMVSLRFGGILWVGPDEYGIRARAQELARPRLWRGYAVARVLTTIQP